MKNKIFCCNDNLRMESLINDWMIGKKIMNISPIIFVHGNFVTQIFYYDIDPFNNKETDENIEGRV